MNKKMALFASVVIQLIAAQVSSALPSFSGKYGGFTRDKVTSLQGVLTPRGSFKDIEIGALSAGCIVEIPGEDSYTTERDTNITEDETPLVRLGASGSFNTTFNLIDESRVDFKDAEVTLQGRIRGGRGNVTITIVFSKTYEDGSSESCTGSSTVYLKRKLR